MIDDELVSLQSRGTSVQFAGGCEPRSPAARSGEHRLMLAILADAVALFEKTLSGGVVTLREGRAALAWFESRDRSLPFTFEYICDVLGLDSGYVRRGLSIVRATASRRRARPTHADARA